MIQELEEKHFQISTSQIHALLLNAEPAAFSNSHWSAPLFDAGVSSIWAQALVAIGSYWCPLEHALMALMATQLGGLGKPAITILSYRNSEASWPVLLALEFRCMAISIEMRSRPLSSPLGWRRKTHSSSCIRFAILQWASHYSHAENISGLVLKSLWKRKRSSAHAVGSRGFQLRWLDRFDSLSIQMQRYQDFHGAGFLEQHVPVKNLKEFDPWRWTSFMKRCWKTDTWIRTFMKTASNQGTRKKFIHYQKSAVPRSSHRHAYRSFPDSKNLFSALMKYVKASHWLLNRS